MKKMPWARPRSLTGNHFENVLATFGQAPASPMPNRNRVASSEA
jgi:hypothetical protein